MSCFTSFTPMMDMPSIFSRGTELGWSRDRVYDFARERLELKQPVTSLKQLGAVQVAAPVGAQSVDAPVRGLDAADAQLDALDRLGGAAQAQQSDDVRRSHVDIMAADGLLDSSNSMNPRTVLAESPLFERLTPAALDALAALAGEGGSVREVEARVQRKESKTTLELTLWGDGFPAGPMAARLVQAERQVGHRGRQRGRLAIVARSASNLVRKPLTRSKVWCRRVT